MVRVDATVSKPGVYNYTRADGTIVREYLPPEEVIKADSLASLEDATVTHRHPGNMVDPGTWGTVSIGHARNARADGNRAAATLVISRADAQSKIGTELVEVSRGVKVRVDETPGITPEGEHYDAVQRDVVYNHIAVGPRGWGRQGAEVALRLDSNGDELAPVEQFLQDSAKDFPMKYTDPKTKIVHEFKSDSELSDFIAARIDAGNPFAKKGEEDEDEKKKKEKKDAAEAAAKALAAEKARADAAQAKLDAIELANKQAARVALETQGKAVLGAAHKFDSAETDTQVRLAVLAKLTPAVKYDGKSDVYVESAFDIALSAAPAGKSRSDSMAAALHGVVAGGLPAAGAREDSEEDRLDARERMIKRNQTLAARKA